MSFIVAAVVAGGAIVGAGVSAYGATKAASTQASAAKNAQAISQNEFQTITGQEQPFLQGGYSALNALNYGLGIGGNRGTNTTPGEGYGYLNQPFTLSQFHNYSPAYQFQLQQGQEGVLGGDSSSQGALSGAALKDLTQFNQGYANTAFNNAFNQYQEQIQNTYGRLAGLTQIGSSAAANLGAQGTTLAGQQAQSAQNIGTALAGGQIGAANAIGGGIGSAGNAALLGTLLNTQGGGGQFVSGLSDQQVQDAIEGARQYYG